MKKLSNFHLHQQKIFWFLSFYFYFLVSVYPMDRTLISNLIKPQKDQVSRLSIKLINGQKFTKTIIVALGRTQPVS